MSNPDDRPRVRRQDGTPGQEVVLSRGAAGWGLREGCVGARGCVEVSRGACPGGDPHLLCVFSAEVACRVGGHHRQVVRPVSGRGPVRRRGPVEGRQSLPACPCRRTRELRAATIGCGPPGRGGFQLGDIRGSGEASAFPDRLCRGLGILSGQQIGARLHMFTPMAGSGSGRGEHRLGRPDLRGAGGSDRAALTLGRRWREGRRCRARITCGGWRRPCSRCVVGPELRDRHACRGDQGSSNPRGQQQRPPSVMDGVFCSRHISSPQLEHTVLGLDVSMPITDARVIHSTRQ
jgi:hypothetical protein